ncbi:MAG: Ig-like domain-containing protein [Deltaproteobacteria bacterium]|nr:Ig-like domain-containing protein [Deltaproteobacteria bacterium]
MKVDVFSGSHRASKLALLVLAVACGGCKSPAAIDVSPETIRLTHERRQLQLRAVVKDSSGSPLEGVPVSFASLTPTIVSAASDGLIRAVKSGTGTVLAKAGNVKQEVSVVVQIAKKVTIDPDGARLNLGVTRKFRASVLDDQDRPLLAIGTVTWESSNPAVATIDAQGNVKTLTEGKTVLIAKVAGLSGSTTLEVKHEKFNKEEGTWD